MLTKMASVPRDHRACEIDGPRSRTTNFEIAHGILSVDSATTAICLHKSPNEDEKERVPKRALRGDFPLATPRRLRSPPETDRASKWSSELLRGPLANPQSPDVPDASKNPTEAVHFALSGTPVQWPLCIAADPRPEPQ